VSNIAGQFNYFIAVNIFGPGNGSPMGTNVVLVVLVLGGCCYQIFNVLRLFHFRTDRH